MERGGNVEEFDVAAVPFRDINILFLFAVDISDELRGSCNVLGSCVQIFVVARTFYTCRLTSFRECSIRAA